GIDFDLEEIENFLNDDSIPFGVKDSPFNMEDGLLFLEKSSTKNLIPIPHESEVASENGNLSFLSTFLRKKESGGNMQITLTNEDDSDPHQEEIDVVTVTDDVLPPSVENEDSDGESEDSDLDNPSIPLPPPKPPDEELDFEKDFGNEISVVRNTIVKFECIDARVKFDVFYDENDDLSYFMFVIFDKEFSFLSAESEDTIFDPGISD
nr:hypothetical protein [Tanacetum cinerariifolium]